MNGRAVILILTALCVAIATGAGPELGRIVVIGDSITQAAGHNYAVNVYAQNANRSYRWPLFKHLVDAGAQFDFVGSLANNYTSDSPYPTWRGVAFNRCHEGHWGWRAYQVRGTSAGPSSGNRGTGSMVQWTDDALGGYTADTAIILIGINDLAEGRTPVQLSNDVAAIVDILQADNRRVRIYLSELLFVGSGHSQFPALNLTVSNYNANFLAPLAAAKTTSNSVVTVVAMNNGQSGGWDADQMTVDNVHPNSRGERFIAARLAAALGLVSEWTPVPVTNGNFEGGFVGVGTTNCRPVGWALYGSPNPAAVPKALTDYSIVAESTVDGVATGTTNSGSSYIIAGPPDTGIKQTLAEPLTAGRHYQLQVSVYGASSALNANDWAVEVWAGATRVGVADNQIKPLFYVTGTGTPIGSRLGEITVDVRADDFPAALGQPLEIRLISRNNVRYVGFEDVRLSWKPVATNPPRHYQIYILTGQSNALGTDNGPEINKLPGYDPADAQVLFWWHNVSGDLYGVSASPGNSIGSSGGFWRTLRAQPAWTNIYANVGNAWGPEINFARAMFHAGETNLAVIKAARGGGGNSFWSRTNADNHMYIHVTNTVHAACRRLVADGHSFKIAGLLYLQGESDNSAEQALAGVRFKQMVDNLRADLPHAAAMHGFMLGNLATPGTRARQEAIAAAHPDYLHYADILDLADELVADNLHHNRKAKLVTGARFATLARGRIADFDAALEFAPVYGQPFGSRAAGVAPLTNLTAVLSGRSPQLQGWSEEPALRDDISIVAVNQSAASLSPDPAGGIPAWNITDTDSIGGGYLYSWPFTGTQLTNLVASGWEYTLRLRFPTGHAEPPAFFFQYGDAAQRWHVNVQRPLTGALIATFATGEGVTNVSLPGDPNAYHILTLRRRPGGAPVELVFDGVTVGEVSATPVDGALEPGVHFGLRGAVAKGSVNVATVWFALARPAISATHDGEFLNLSWPAGHRGWGLETQTNLPGMGLEPAPWFRVPGSTATNRLIVPLAPAPAAAFFRLVWP